jgi:hypothetical protein
VVGQRSPCAYSRSRRSHPDTAPGAESTTDGKTAESPPTTNAARLAHGIFANTNIASERTARERTSPVPSTISCITSKGIFFPDENSLFLGCLRRLPLFADLVRRAASPSGLQIPISLSEVPKEAGVYVFAAANPLGCAKGGASDIVYIGYAGDTDRGNLRERIAFYAQMARREVARRDRRYASEFKIANYYDDNADIKLGWIVSPTAEVAYDEEKRLLSDFEGEHGALPLLNGQRRH